MLGYTGRAFYDIFTITLGVKKFMSIHLKYFVRGFVSTTFNGAIALSIMTLSIVTFCILKNLNRHSAFKMTLSVPHAECQI